MNFFGINIKKNLLSCTLFGLLICIIDFLIIEKISIRYSYLIWFGILVLLVLGSILYIAYDRFYQKYGVIKDE